MRLAPPFARLAGAVLLVVVLLSAAIAGADSGAGSDEVRVAQQGEPGSPVLDSPELREAADAWRHEMARREAARATPEAVAERERARTAFQGLTADEALALGRRKFPVAFQPLWEPLRLDEDERLVRVLDEDAALVEGEEDGRTVRSLAETDLPLRSREGNGDLALADLALERTAEGYEPSNPLVDTELPRELADGLSLPDARVALRPDVDDDVAAPTVERDRLFFHESHADTDTLITPRPVGGEVSLLLRSRRSPEAFGFELAAPAGSVVRRQAGQVLVQNAEGESIATLSAPIALDADGELVPTSYEVDGAHIRLRVEHRDRDVRMPVLVDPVLEATNELVDQYNIDATQPTAPTGTQQGGVNGTMELWGNGLASRVERPFYEPTRSGYGIYISARAMQMAQYDYYEVFWRIGLGSSRTARIHRADFGYVDHWPQNTCVIEGVWHDAISGGRSAGWETGIWRNGPSGATGGTSPLISSGPNCLALNNNYKAHIPSESTRQHDNQAVWGVMAHTAGARTAAHVAHLYGSAMFISDAEAPTFTTTPTSTFAPSGGTAASRRWGDTGTLAVSAPLRDNGLGPREARIYRTGAPTHSARGFTSCTGEQNYGFQVNRCPSTATLSLTDLAVNSATVPDEGDGQLSVRGYDVLLKPTATQPTLTFGVDRTPPSVSLSGDLWQQRKQTLVLGGHSVVVNATDGESTNSPSTSRSGVARVRVTIRRKDTNAVVGQAQEHTTSSTCTANCRLDAGSGASGSEFKFPKLANGHYTVTVEAFDRIHADQTTDALRARHKTVESWDIEVDHDPIKLPRDAALGLEEFFHYDSTDAGGDTAVHVNQATGNAVWHGTPLVNPGRGLSTVANVTYNSLDAGGVLRRNNLASVIASGVLSLDDPNGTSNLLPGVVEDAVALSYGEIGAGFSLGIAGLTRVNEPLIGVITAATAQNNITLIDPDGTRHVFAYEDGQRWKAPAGVQLHLRRFKDVPPGGREPKAWAATRPDGVTYFFDELGFATSIEDRNGNVIRFVYESYAPTTGALLDASNKLCAELSPAVPEDGIACARRLVEVRAPGYSSTDPDAGRRRVKISYYGGGVLASSPVELPFSFPTPLGRVGGDAGRIKQLEDAAGRVTEFQYNSDGYLTHLIEAKGKSAERRTRLSYEEASGTLDEVLGPLLGQDRKLRYVVQQNGSADNWSDGHATEVRYERPPEEGESSTARRSTRVVNRRGHAATYDDVKLPSGGELARQSTIVNAEGERTVVRLDAKDRPRQIVTQPDQSGGGTGSGDRLVTELRWDEDHNVTEVREGRASQEVSGLGQLVESVATTMAYNDNGLLTRRTDPRGEVTELTYDSPAGAATDPAGGPWVSQLRTMVTPEGGVWSFDVDASGNVTHRWNPEAPRAPQAPSEAATNPGAAARTTYGQHGLIETETDEAGNLTRFADYDAGGLPQTVIDPRGHRADDDVVDLDATDSEPGQADRSSGRWVYGYDAVGNVTQVTDPRHAVQGGPSAQPDEFSVRLDYDALDRVLLERRPKGRGSQPGELREESTYDRNGNLLTRTDATHATHTFTYTATDQIERVTAPAAPHVAPEQGAGETMAAAVTEYSYDKVDRLESETQPLGVASSSRAGDYVTRYVHDDAGRLVSSVREHPGTGGALDRLATGYAYDYRDNLVGLTDPRHAASEGCQAPAEVDVRTEACRRFTFGYDAADNRVLQVEDPGGLNLRTEWAYDGNGNVDHVISPRAADSSDPLPDASFKTDYTYDERDLLTEIRDGLGNLTRYTRRADGLVTDIVTPRGTATSGIDGDFATHLTYDAGGNVIGRSLPWRDGEYGLPRATLERRVIRYVRDGAGNPTTIRDARGRAFQNTFLYGGELASTERPSWWQLDWGAAQETPDPGARFGQNGASSDTAVPAGGPQLVERDPLAARQDGRQDLPSSEGPTATDFGEVDPLGLPDHLPQAGATTFSYDDQLRLTGVTDVASRTRSLSYDALGRMREKRWPHDGTDEIVHDFKYDQHDQLRVSRTNAAPGGGQVLQAEFLYDGFGRRIAERTPGAGQQDTAEVNAAGYESPVEVTELGYDPNGNLIRRQTARGPGHTFRYAFDAADRLTDETNPAGETWHYTLDANGNRTGECSPRGVLTPSGGPTSCRSNFQARLRFDGVDRLSSVIDNLGETTSFTYDANGNRTMVSAPGAAAAPGGADLPRLTAVEYDGRDLPWITTTGTSGTTGDDEDHLGTTSTAREFDANGNLRRVVSNMGLQGQAPRRADTGQPAQGDQPDAELKQATEHATVFDYSSDDLLVAEHLPWGDRDTEDRRRYHREFPRTERGFIRSIQAPHEANRAAPTTSFTYYDTGWIRSSSESELRQDNEPVYQHQVDYTYDARGNQTSWTSTSPTRPGGRTITRSFWPNNLLRERRAVAIADDGTRRTRAYRYYYNQNRSLVSMVDANLDRTTTFSRDDAEREVDVDERWSGGRDTRFAYDPNGNVVDRWTDGHIDDSGAYVDPADARGGKAKRTRYVFDELDRETEMQVGPPSSFSGGGNGQRRVETDYYPSGQRERRERFAGDNGSLSSTEERFYTSVGDLLERRRRPAGGTLTSVNYDYNYETGNGLRTKDERGTYRFDSRDRLVRWTRGARQDDPGTTVDYTLNGSGALLEVQDSADDDPDPTRYKYEDGAERLDHVTAPDGSVSRYHYNRFGSVERVTLTPGDGTVLPPPGGATPNLPEDCADTFGEQRGTTYYCHDPFERLLVAQGPDVEQPELYTYDGLDRRDTRTVRRADGSDRRTDYSYIGASNQLSREVDPSANDPQRAETYDYHANGERAGQTVTNGSGSSTFRAYSTDANGSVEGLESTSGQLSDADRYDYDPFGAIEGDEGDLSTSAQENPFRFEGFYYDSGIKLYDMQARSYRPDIGRFLTQDRFEQSLGDQNLESDPLTQNRYAFAGGNPVNFVEFDGHDLHGVYSSCVAAGRANCGREEARANANSGGSPAARVRRGGVAYITPQNENSPLALGLPGVAPGSGVVQTPTRVASRPVLGGGGVSVAGPRSDGRSADNLQAIGQGIQAAGQAFAKDPCAILLTPECEARNFVRAVQEGDETTVILTGASLVPGGRLLEIVGRVRAAAGRLASVIGDARAILRTRAIASRHAASPERLRTVQRALKPDGGLNVSRTVARQLQPGGPRENIPVQAILDTLGAGSRAPDPKGVPDHFMYRMHIERANGHRYVLEVLQHEPSGELRHVLMRGAQ